MNSVFFSNQNKDKYLIRLCVLIHFLNTEFSEKMRQNEQKHKMIECVLNVDCDVENVFKDE